MIDWNNIEERLEKLLSKTDYEKHFDEDENRKIMEISERVSRNFIVWNGLYKKVKMEIKKSNEEDSIFLL